MPPRRGDGSGGADGAREAALPPIVFHPHSVEVVARPEGYRELRCLPATWSYAETRPFAALLSEFYSERMGVDPQGLGVEAEFWSGSDAALRLQSLPREDLAARELTALATRRSVGLNAPKPWLSWPDVRELATGWEPEATEVHFSQYPIEERPSGLWLHYGMGQSHAQLVVYGYGMRESGRALPGSDAEPAWQGGTGTWYAWSAVDGWELWPRRQDAGRSASPAEPGSLLLFVSHRWESLDHPDPRGAQLLSLKVGLTLAVAAAVLRLAEVEPREPTVSGLPELLERFLDAELAVDAQAAAQWARRIRAAARRARTERTFWRKARELETPAIRPLLEQVRDRVLLWYDYSSMFQAPRSRSEEAAFRAEILQLNAIQRPAGTLVIAGDTQYLSRAWCFLELCAGMRRHLVELTPSWGTSVGVGEAVTRWASRTDQLIGALNVLGPDALRYSGLEATHPEDLGAIAHLLAELPLAGLVETDDSDLVGGALPLPFRDGVWMLPGSTVSPAPERIVAVPPAADFGRLPTPRALRRAAERAARVDALDAPVGVWVYTTERALTLAWADRAGEFLAAVRDGLADGDDLGGLEPLASTAVDPPIACLWADARSLADDGLGWTRAIPSSARVLVVVTQTDIPDVCLIYERVVVDHLACGVRVITYLPDTGRAVVHARPEPNAKGRPADVLAVPRIRRSEVRPNRMFLAAGLARADVEVLAALRLDPAQGVVPPGRVIAEAADAGFGTTGDEVTPGRLLRHSEARVRAEALARSTAATWDEWCTARLHQGAWQVGMAPLQLHVIEQLVRKAAEVSDNPFKRRKLIKLLVDEHEGYALPPSILDDADTLIAMIREREASDDA